MSDWQCEVREDIRTLSLPLVPGATILYASARMMNFELPGDAMICLNVRLTHERKGITVGKIVGLCCVFVDIIDASVGWVIKSLPYERIEEIVASENLC